MFGTLFNFEKLSRHFMSKFVGYFLTNLNELRQVWTSVDQFGQAKINSRNLINLY